MNLRSANAPVPTPFLFRSIQCRRGESWQRCRDNPRCTESGCKTFLDACHYPSSISFQSLSRLVIHLSHLFQRFTRTSKDDSPLHVKVDSTPLDRVDGFFVCLLNERLIRIFLRLGFNAMCFSLLWKFMLNLWKNWLKVLYFKSIIFSFILSFILSIILSFIL